MKHIKTKALLLSTLLAGVLILSSCGNSQPAAGANDQNAAPNDSQASSVNSPRTPQPQADVFGEVKAVSGNDITVALIKMPQRPANGQSPRGQGNNNQKAPGDSSQPQGSRPQGQGNNGQRQGGGFGGPRQYTGETQTVTVTDATPITERSMGNGNRNNNGGGNGNSSGNQRPEAKTIKVSDVKVGSIIQVWYKSGTKDVDKIQVMQIPAAS